MDYDKLMERSFSDLAETLLNLVDWDDEKINLDYVKITDEEEQKKMIIKQIMEIK